MAHISQVYSHNFSKVAQMTLQMYEHVVYNFPLLIFPFQLSLPISSILLTRLSEIILCMFYVTTSAPHHLTWRVLPAPYTKISAKYPCTFHCLLQTLIAASLNLNGYRLIPLPLTLQFNLPNYSTFQIYYLDGPWTLPVPA